MCVCVCVCMCAVPDMPMIANPSLLLSKGWSKLSNKSPKWIIKHKLIVND